MNTKHTPGPWRHEGQGILIDPRNGATVATERIGTSFGEIEVVDPTNEQDRNLRLLIAAPELLAALLECEAWFELETVVPRGTARKPAHETDMGRRMIAQAKAAIKAAGGVPL